MDEELNMSKKQIDRLHVIRNVIEKRLTWGEAAQILKRTERTIGRQVAKVRREGNRGIIHGLKGQPSNHQGDPELLGMALSALHNPLWEGFGPTFAMQKLEEYYGITLSDWAVRQRMTQTNIWHPRRQGKTHRAWRERRSCVGMLIQVDGSDHDWFEGRGPRCVLLIYIDDATSRILYGEFVKVEDTLTLMRSTRAYLLRHGRPVAFYVDKDSIYKINRQASIEEDLRDIQPITQFTRAMGELDVTVICADSPQAKGRVERGFDTHQDRLVKELRLAGACNMEQGNAFLSNGYFDGHNARYAVPPASPTNVHRPLHSSHRLDQILSLRTERSLASDNTLRFQNKFYQLFEEQPVRVSAKDRIEFEIRLDGTTHLRFKGSYLRFGIIAKKPYRPYLVARPSAARPRRDEPGYKGVGSTPAKDHPWRRLFLHGPYHVALPGASGVP